MFAIGRLSGMIAQRKEMHDAVPLKIGRPRQIYTGSNLRHYVPLTKRKRKGTGHLAENGSLTFPGHSAYTAPHAGCGKP
ncbi:MAG: hypothetical protein MZU95_01770 [Desulfomicrobium escambiense]|nr:hypothetical protein [Desulfomicrobium escambiense]